MTQFGEIVVFPITDGPLKRITVELKPVMILSGNWGASVQEGRKNDSCSKENVASRKKSVKSRKKNEGGRKKNGRVSKEEE